MKEVPAKERFCQTLLTKRGGPVKLTGWALATKLECILEFGTLGAVSTAAAAWRISSADALLKIMFIIRIFFYIFVLK